MNVCILGSGLTGFTLAKALVNQGIRVDIFSSKNKSKKDINRTLGISKFNLDFFNEEILNIEKLIWNIKKIEIFTDSLKDERILNFENNNNSLFSMIRNDVLVNLLFSLLKKEKLCNFKMNSIDINLKKKYDLIFNCDYFNSITKKFFFKQMKKDYNSFAYTTIIKHSKTQNNKAVQIFTKRGPLAFLPLSETETSIVYSVKGYEKFDLKEIIKKYNTNYKIKNIRDPSKFELSSSNLRTYYYNNILAFGDLLHKIHPLAGQGFNMILRDIKEIINLIKLKKENGLVLDKSICIDFEKNVRNKNYLFSAGIDLIYEFFSLENNVKNNILSKSVKYFGKNKNINKIFTKIADNGLVL
tara:strand:+ start:43 stop:1110 length:1068 start_codon:yes stop_codon:yes gene_type:complete